MAPGHPPEGLGHRCPPPPPHHHHTGKEEGTGKEKAKRQILSPCKLHTVFHLKGGICVQKKDAQFPCVSTRKLRIKKRRNLKYIFLVYQRNASSQRYEETFFLAS